MWNQSIPDELRGRMAGIELLSYCDRTAARQCTRRVSSRSHAACGSIASGGILCAAGVLALAAALPSLWGLRRAHVAARRSGAACARDRDAARDVDELVTPIARVRATTSRDTNSLYDANMPQLSVTL